MCFIKYACRIPLRMTEEELIIGDDAIHGEVSDKMQCSSALSSIALTPKKSSRVLVHHSTGSLANTFFSLQEAYCFYDHMDGIEPSDSTQKHAAERQRMMMTATSRKMHQPILEGQAIDTPEGQDRTPPTKEEEEGREVKMD